MFDNGFNNMIAKYIKNKNPNVKTILWYWNPINEYSKGFLESKYIDEFWTYNKSDANQYKIKYNTQFYSQNVVLDKKDMEYDVSFLGNAKGRKADIVEIEKILNEKDIQTNFKIIENKKDYIKYDDYLEIISKSKCILDYNMNQQAPLTLRPLEALFLNKKLITNNKQIERYDFYNPNNIFILGKDDINDIKQFIESQYENINEKIIKNYDFFNWMKRFNV